MSFDDDEAPPSRPDPDVGDGPFDPLHLPLEVPSPPRPTIVIDTTDGPSHRRVIVIDQAHEDTDAPSGVVVIELA